MSTFNNWGSDLNEDSLGDTIYDSLEQEAKDGATELAKDGIKESARAADKITDHIAPVKNIKDKAKDKLANNPITRAKTALKKTKDKVKQKTAKLARDGVRATGKAAVSSAKTLGRTIAANPVAAVIGAAAIFIIVPHIGSAIETDPAESSTDNSVLQENPIYVDVDNMSDDDMVTVIMMDDCMEQEHTVLEEMVAADKEQKAKQIYSVFRSFGLNNVTIAGMFGNLDRESGFDPSSIEGIYDEYGILGTKKAAAFQSISNYTKNTLFPKYAARGVHISKNGYKTTDKAGKTVYYCGLGFIQWTGGNAKTFLEAADSVNKNWYDADFQLGYMLCDKMYRPGFFAELRENQEAEYNPGSESYEAGLERAKKACVHFAHGYEGNTSSDEKRKKTTEKWFEIMCEWGDEQVDQTIVDSATNLAGQLGATIALKDLDDAQNRCKSTDLYDNSSLAAAAVSYAWPTKAQCYNNGTKLYQMLHDAIFPTDHIYKSCDRSVATAVRWSGTDDTFPIGNTNAQLRYLEESTKWEQVGMASSLTVDDLQPGDIFCLNGHIFMYVSKEVVQSAYTGEADPNSDSVSGSIGERSPCCDVSTTSILNRNGQDWLGRGVYHVYRCITPDNSTTYTSLGGGVKN